MSPEINLLPEELKPKGYALKLSKSLKKIATISLSVFFVTLALFIASNVLFSWQLRNLTSEETKLKNEIKALEDTEQKLVLTKDRLEKIGTILSYNDALEEVEIGWTIMDKNVPNISIEGVHLDKDKAIFTVSTDNSLNLTRFFAQTLTLNFISADLVSFSFEKDKGYKVEIAVAK